MTHGPTSDTTPWPQRQNLLIARQTAHYRRVRGLTADQLAEKVSDLGFPLSRSMVANIESGRRSQTGMSVAVLMALAAALDISPLQLLYPIGEKDDQVEVLPGRHVDARTAARWFEGSAPLGEETDEWKAGVAPLARLHAHDQHVIQWEQAHTRARVEHAAMRIKTDEYEREMSMARWHAQEDAAQRALRALAVVRQQMADAGQPLPEVPEDLRSRLDGAQ
ncbi:helix-turn-helix transcriptional regulator [Saccharopolyspora shandongensis]|uniref:helix-turn-helix transcriptional regulator n=1 Tax=Saccharopolyspora shandongensis TaxID=418495 RepID=UPI0033F73AC8